MAERRLAALQVTVYYNINKVSDVKQAAGDLKAAPTLQAVRSSMQKDGAWLCPSSPCPAAALPRPVLQPFQGQHLPTSRQSKRAHTLRMTHHVTMSKLPSSSANMDTTLCPSTPVLPLLHASVSAAQFHWNGRR